MITPETAVLGGTIVAIALFCGAIFLFGTGRYWPVWSVGFVSALIANTIAVEFAYGAHGDRDLQNGLLVFVGAYGVVAVTVAAMCGVLLAKAGGVRDGQIEND